MSQQRIQILGLIPRKVLDLGSRFQERSQIQVLRLGKGSRFRSLVHEKFLVFDPRPKKGPRFRSHVLEKVLDLGPKAWKRYQIQLLGPRKGPSIRSQTLETPQIQFSCPRKDPKFRAYGIEIVIDLDHSSQQSSQIQVLGPRKALDLGPMSQKWFQVQGDLRTRKRHRFRSQFLARVLDLGPSSSIQVLDPIKYPRFGPPQALDLASRSQKRFQILVVSPRNVLDLGASFKERSQIQVLRLLEKVLHFCPQSWKSPQIFALGPHKGPGFSSQLLENVLALVRKAWRRSLIQLLGPRKMSQIQLLVPRKGSRFISSVLEKFLGFCPRS